MNENFVFEHIDPKASHHVAKLKAYQDELKLAQKEKKTFEENKVLTPIKLYLRCNFIQKRIEHHCAEIGRYLPDTDSRYHCEHNGVDYIISTEMDGNAVNVKTLKEYTLQQKQKQKESI